MYDEVFNPGETNSPDKLQTPTRVRKLFQRSGSIRTAPTLSILSKRKQQTNASELPLLVVTIVQLIGSCDCKIMLTGVGLKPDCNRIGVDRVKQLV